MKAKTLAMLNFDGIALLLPQESVVTIAMLSESLEHYSEVESAVGTLKASDQDWPVFALTSEFRIRGKCPTNYKYGVAFRGENDASFAVACEEVNTLSVDDLDVLKPVQLCMRTPECPVDSLLLNKNVMMLVCETETFFQYLMPEASQL